MFPPEYFRNPSVDVQFSIPRPLNRVGDPTSFKTMAEAQECCSSRRFSRTRPHREIGMTPAETAAMPPSSSAGDLITLTRF